MATPNSPRQAIRGLRTTRVLSVASPRGMAGTEVTIHTVLCVTFHDSRLARHLVASGCGGTLSHTTRGHDSPVRR